MATTPAPPPISPVATVEYYCAKCGLVTSFIAAKAVRAKQHPICPVDSNPMKPIEEAANDPDLQ